MRTWRVHTRRAAFVAALFATMSIAVLSLGPAAGGSASGAAAIGVAARRDRGTDVIVKFRDGVAARDQSELLSGLADDFRALPAHRLFTTSVERLNRTRSRIVHSHRRRFADLTKYYRVATPDGATASALVARLRASHLVETAYRPAPPVPPPATPSFVDQQGYRNAAPPGIGAAAVASVPGATGAAVKIIDVEYSWNQQHEDLTKARTALIPNGTPNNPFPDDNHGTAVLGELVADANGFGVTGLVPDASLGLVNADNVERFYDLANSIDLAHHQMRAGDVMLIEQQRAGITCDACYVPVEWDKDVYDAILSATADGVFVVEPAGNGGENLDDPQYGSSFPDGRPSSGALMVGAGDGCNTSRARLGFSDYGTRVDFQGWGSCVVTTGYTDLYAQGPNATYTRSFSGTSSASPMVASAVASFSSAYRTHFGTAPSLALVRSVFQATGSPQTFGSGALTGNIGPQPNLVAALAAGLTRPANDDLANAQVLSGATGSITGSTTGATKEPGEPNHAGDAGGVGGASVWYQWTAPASGTLTVNTFGSGFDTRLETYTGSSVAALTPIVANDNDNGVTQSRVGAFGVSAGTKYLIAVDGTAGAMGPVTVAWQSVATAPPLSALPGRLVP